MSITERLRRKAGARGGPDSEGPVPPQEAPGAQAPKPQPERFEPKIADPGVRDLSRRDYLAIVKRSAKEALNDQITDLAAALAYYSFLAIPAALLVAVGVFTLVLSPADIQTLMSKFSGVVPKEATDLLGDALTRIQPGSATALIGVGTLLALWTTTGAMTAYMRALNRAYERTETRGFLRQRLVALAMVAVIALAFVLVLGLLILGPAISDAIGQALGIPAVVTTIWWIAQWPILVVGLLAAFATLLYLGPNVEHPRWRFLTPGALVAVIVWLLASGGFAVYTSMFGSYNKTWGSLAAVIVMLTWLWLTGISLLLGAEINAETERSRELRQGEPAERQLQAPAQGRSA